ncbi:Fungal N-terminal domain-containing protein [Pleurotus pulmonarius]
MDPLSITTAILTLVDVALKIKDSVERVGKNRKQLLYLSEDILQTLYDLQDLCRAREHALRGAPELHQSLNRLSSQLSDVHARCEKTFCVPSHNTFAKVKFGFKQWLKADDVEDDIARLKEQVQSCLLRFTVIISARTELLSTQTALASARIEHTVLVLKVQQRANINQFDRLYGQGFLGPDRAKVPQPALFHNIDREYLHMKMCTIIEGFEAHDFLQITNACIPGDVSLTSAYPAPLGVFKSLKTFKGTIAKAWEVTQLLEGHLELLGALECALAMLWLGCELHALGLMEDAVLNDSCVVQLLRTLSLSSGGHRFLPYLGYALTDLNWTMGDDAEGALIICKEAVDVFRSLQNPDVHHPLNYVYALRSLGARYLEAGQPLEALSSFQDALQVVRSTDRASIDESDDATSYLIPWEALGQAKSIDDVKAQANLAAPPGDFIMIQHESLILFGMVNALQSLGRRSEAFSVGRDAIDVMEPLQSTTEGKPAYVHSLCELLSELQDTVAFVDQFDAKSNLCKPMPPIVVGNDVTLSTDRTMKYVGQEEE